MSPWPHAVPWEHPASALSSSAPAGRGHSQAPHSGQPLNLQHTFPAVSTFWGVWGLLYERGQKTRWLRKAGLWIVRKHSSLYNLEASVCLRLAIPLCIRPA